MKLVSNPFSENNMQDSWRVPDGFLKTGSWHLFYCSTGLSTMRMIFKRVVGKFISWPGSFFEPLVFFRTLGFFHTIRKFLPYHFHTTIFHTFKKTMIIVNYCKTKLSFFKITLSKINLFFKSSKIIFLHRPSWHEHSQFFSHSNGEHSYFWFSENWRAVDAVLQNVPIHHRHWSIT